VRLPGSLRQALPTFGAWFSPRDWLLDRPLWSDHRHRRPSQAVDPAQEFRGEQGARHRHLGQLEDHVAVVAHDPGADLHELLAQGRERPMRHFVRQLACPLRSGPP
jgi:hypothetical protein